MRRRLAILMLVLAVGAAVVAASRWWSANREIGALLAEKAALATELDSTRTRLQKAGLRYRGFLQGQANVPDSLRLAEAGRSMEISNLYRKSITGLEGDERRLERLIAKLDHRIADATSARRRGAMPAAALAAVLLACGAVLYAAGRTRGVAP